MNSSGDSSQVSKRGDQSDGSVAAHPNVADVVEVDNARRAVRIHRLT